MSGLERSPREALVAALRALDNSLRVVASSALEELVTAELAELAAAEDDVQSIAESVAVLPGSLASAKTRLEAAIDRRTAAERLSPSGVERAVGELQTLTGEQSRFATRQLIGLFVELLEREELELCRQVVESPSASDVFPDAVRQILARTLDAVALGHPQRAAEGLAGMQREVESQSTGRSARAILRRLSMLRALFVHASAGTGAAERALRSDLGTHRDPVLLAELSQLLTLEMRIDEARALANEAIETSPERGDGYIARGHVDDRNSDPAAAVEQYRLGLSRLAIGDLESLDSGTFLEPTGLLRREWALQLEAAGLPKRALIVAAQALEQGVVGPELYPDTQLFELQVRLIPDVQDAFEERAAAALQAGQRLLWVDDPARALEHLTIAVEAGEDQPTAGWYLADAYSQLAWRTDPPAPDFVRLGIGAWQRWYDAVGPPATGEAWAYRVVASLEEDLVLSGAVSASDSTSARWRAVMRNEQALLLDPRDVSSWDMSIRLLRDLRLNELALESVTRGLELDPDNDALLQGALMLQTDTGRFEECLAFIQRHSLKPSPWLSGVRAWLHLHLGDSAAALREGRDALASPLQRGWVLDVMASAEFERGDVGAALEHLRDLTNADHYHGESSAFRRARAFALQGDVEQARQLIDELPEGSRTEEYWALLVVLDAWSGNVVDALEHSESLREHVDDERARDELVMSWREALLALRAQDGPSEGVRALEEAIATVRSMVLKPRRTAEDELQPSTDESAQRTALLAIRARRDASAGRTEDAVKSYEALLATEMHTEVIAPLAAALRSLRDAAVEVGDADRARSLHERLTAISPVPEESLDIVVAVALVMRGDFARGRARLIEAATRRQSSLSARFSAAVPLASLAISWEQKAEALDALHSIHLDAAQQQESSIVLHVSALRGVIAAGDGQLAKATELFAEALRAADGSGVVDQSAAFTVALEIRGALNRMAQPMDANIRSAYSSACVGLGLEPVESALGEQEGRDNPGLED